MKSDIKTKLDTFSIRRSDYHIIYDYYARPNFTHTMAAYDVLSNEEFWEELQNFSTINTEDINWSNAQEVLWLLDIFFGYKRISSPPCKNPSQ